MTAKTWQHHLASPALYGALLQLHVALRREPPGRSDCKQTQCPSNVTSTAHAPYYNKRHYGHLKEQRQLTRSLWCLSAVVRWHRESHQNRIEVISTTVKHERLRVISPIQREAALRSQARFPATKRIGTVHARAESYHESHSDACVVTVKRHHIKLHGLSISSIGPNTSVTRSTRDISAPLSRGRHAAPCPDAPARTYPAPQHNSAHVRKVFTHTDGVHRRLQSSPCLGQRQSCCWVHRHHASHQC